MELGALVDVDHAVGGRLPVPNGVVQEALDPGEDDLEYGETAAQSFAGQEVTLLRNLGLFGIPHFVNILDNLKRGVLGLEALLFGLGLFSLCNESKTWRLL